jgi:hypothetical protein
VDIKRCLQGDDRGKLGHAGVGAASRPSPRCNCRPETWIFTTCCPAIAARSRKLCGPCVPSGSDFSGICIRTTSARGGPNGWRRCVSCGTSWSSCYRGCTGCRQTSGCGLSEQLACEATPIEADIDKFQAYRNDVAAVQRIAEAALEIERNVRTSLACEAALTVGLSVAAQETAGLLSVLDTTTAGAVAIDSDCPALEIGADVDIDLIHVTTALARIERLRHRVEQVLVGLERRHGPERYESLRWLVWELCDLYHRETGRPVTNSGDHVSRCNASGTRYTGTPQSPAGRFVLAVVTSLRLSRAHPRAVLFAMREYVARHPDAGRRGRKPGK